MPASSLCVYQDVELPGAPALLPNNLVIHRGGAYASYATPTALVSVQTSNGVPCFRPLSFPPGVYVEALAGVTESAVENLFLLAALSDGTAMVVVNGQQTHVVSRAAPVTAVAAMSAAGPSGEVVAVVGDAEGGVDVLRFTAQGQPLLAAVASVPVQAHERRGIAALDVCADEEAVSTAMVISGDAAGHVVVWRGVNPVLCLPPPNAADAVAAVKLLSGTSHAAVAYGGGGIRVVERESGSAVLELHAHARWINTLAYSSALQMMVSAAEDGQVYVWDVHASDPQCVCVAHGAVPHELLTGAAILGAQKAVTLLSYDVSKLRLLSF